MPGQTPAGTNRWPYVQRDRPHVVVAGGGVAALEACLVLRRYLREHELEITLLAPNERFEHRPISVLEPFERAPAWSLSLSDFADDNGIELVADSLRAVAPHGRTAITGAESEVPYDALLIAVGARAVVALPGALTFRGSRDAADFRAMLDHVASLHRPQVTYAVPAGASWPLPLYELALLTRSALRRRRVEAQLRIVTPEASPLAVFGTRASDHLTERLAAAEIEVVASATPSAVIAGELQLTDGRRLATDHVVALPRLCGRRIDGVPHDAEDFIPVDAHARVPELSSLYAAGDVTDLPWKHGGLAARQADTAAEAIAAELGVPIAPRPFRPVIQGVLYTGGVPAYLHNAIGEDDRSMEPRAYSMWWPPSKIAGRLLGPYLTIRAGAPRAPEERPAHDVVAVRVDLSTADAGPAATP